MDVPREIETPEGYEGVYAGRIRFTNVIGRGSTSRVYIVIAGGGDILACKVVSKSLLEDGFKLKIFAEETKIHRHLKHPSIVQSYFNLEDSKNYYLFMDYCTDGTLYSLVLTRGHQSESIVGEFIAQLLIGIKFLHSKNIIHRDLKPENVYLNKGNIKIGDFGYAVKSEPANQKHYIICGTIYYMSPELLTCAATGGYSYEVDMWSVGIITYFMLAGTKPFNGDTKDSVIRSILHMDCEKLTSISLESKNFLSRLITSREFRMDVSTAIKHDFISSFATPHTFSLTSTDLIDGKSYKIIDP